MNSSDDFLDGARAGRDANAPPTAARRTSSAFGSPGTDSTVKRIDLNEELIKHPEATFLMRAAGHDMIGAGISDGDVLLVDRAISGVHDTVVIAVVEGELLCRRLDKPSGDRRGAPRIRLLADAGVTHIEVTPEMPLEIWGVVTTVIKRLV